MNKNSSNKAFSAAFFEFARKAGPGCRLRLAPTPSGYLHRGNALNFILNWLIARLNNGSVLLRIDDLDGDRKRTDYVADIFQSLEWLGLDYDEGPGLKAGDDPVADFERKWSQHLRLPVYESLLQQLRSGGHVFACRKSRSELAAFNGRYPPEFRLQHLDLDADDVAWRLKTDHRLLPWKMQDFVVRRRDSLPAYQIASVADDLQFRITHVVRGVDLTASTEAQRYLAELLHADTFLSIAFLHHPLVLDENGAKLSKSAGAAALRFFRENGVPPSAIYESVAELLQMAPAQTAEALLSAAKARL